MKTRTLPLLMLAMSFFSACTHLRTFKTYDDINTFSKDREGWIKLSTGGVIAGQDIQISSDSTLWREPDSNQRQSVATSQIREISIKNSGRGAWEGFGIGLLAGAATGAVIGFASGDDSGADGQELLSLPLSWFQVNAEQKVTIGAILGGGIGGLVGLTIGASTGSKDKFVLQENKNASK